MILREQKHWDLVAKRSWQVLVREMSKERCWCEREMLSKLHVTVEASLPGHGGGCMVCVCVRAHRVCARTHAGVCGCVCAGVCSICVYVTVETSLLEHGRCARGVCGAGRVCGGVCLHVPTHVHKYS